MAKLTPKEKKWLTELQEHLNACPSKRLGFYTIGDPCVMAYNKDKQADIEKILDSGKRDFCQAARATDADFCGVYFPSAVLSTAG